MVIQTVVVFTSILGGWLQMPIPASPGSANTRVAGTVLVANHQLAAASPWDNPNPGRAPSSAASKKKKAKPASTTQPARSGATSGKSGSKPAAGSEDEDAEDSPPPVRKRKPAVEESSNSEADEEEDEAPRAKRRIVHKKAADDEDDGEEEDDDEDAPMEAMAVVLPRLFSAELGGSFFGRSFAFNTPLQSEKSFRMGGGINLESYPLLRMPHGFYKRFGVGVTFQMETGQAAVPQTNGSTISFPVSQTRWYFDVRYPFLFGSRVAVIPAVGYGISAFDLKRATPVSPSACPAGSAEACLPDIQLSNLVADVHIRVAATESLGFALHGGYLLGIAVSRQPGNIATEAPASAAGYHADLGSTFLLTDWLGLFGRVSVLHYGYSFTSTTVTYRSASETYFGALAGVTLFTK